MKMLSSFTNLHIIPNLYDFLGGNIKEIFFSVKHSSIYILCLAEEDHKSLIIFR